jgi:hypothetical protein
MKNLHLLIRLKAIWIALTRRRFCVISLGKVQPDGKFKIYQSNNMAGWLVVPIHYDPKSMEVVIKRLNTIKADMLKRSKHHPIRPKVVPMHTQKGGQKA